MSACCGSGIPPHVVRSKLQEGQSTKTLQSLRLGPPIRPSLRPCVDTFHPSLIPGARAGYAGQVSQQEDQQASLPLLPPTWGHIIHASPRTRRHQPNLPRAETLGVGGRNELDMYVHVNNLTLMPKSLVWAKACMKPQLLPVQCADALLTLNQYRIPFQINKIILQ